MFTLLLKEFDMQGLGYRVAPCMCNLHNSGLGEGGKGGNCPPPPPHPTLLEMFAPYK